MEQSLWIPVGLKIIVLVLISLWLVNLPPPRYPPAEIGGLIYEGLINHCFPSIRPAIKPLFLKGGGSLGWGLVDQSSR